MHEGPLHVVILNGSMRPRGNTAELLKPLMNALMMNGAHVQYVALHDKNIAPCDACWQCQHVANEPGCPKSDDMRHLYKLILHADVLVLATPIYTWYCTTPMKSVLDRLYALSKYYGEVKDGAMLRGKALAVVCTCGYPEADACRPFEDGMRQYAAHAKMDYLGMLSERDEDDLASFQTEAAVAKSRAFAKVILARAD